MATLGTLGASLAVVLLVLLEQPASKSSAAEIALTMVTERFDRKAITSL